MNTEDLEALTTKYGVGIRDYTHRGRIEFRPHSGLALQQDFKARYVRKN